MCRPTGGKTVGGGYTPGDFATNDQVRAENPGGDAGGATKVAAYSEGSGALPAKTGNARPGRQAKGPGSGVQLYYWRDSNSQLNSTE